MPRRKKSSVMLRKDLQPGAHVFILSAAIPVAWPLRSQWLIKSASYRRTPRRRGGLSSTVFTDEARKAADMEHRDAFTAMTKACRNAPRPVGAPVVVWSFHRLFRDEVDAAYHKSDLRRHGVEFVSATQKVPENFAVLYEAVLHTVARIQIDQMAIDVTHSLPRPPGGRFCATGHGAHRLHYAERVQSGHQTRWIATLCPQMGGRSR